MGTPINTPLTSEIWHLTIDDLLEPLPASPRLGGPGPFVINLSASTAPISVPMKPVADVLPEFAVSAPGDEVTV